MVYTDSILQMVDEVHEKLACPLSSQEEADGWTQESKDAMKVFFEALKGKIVSGEQLTFLNIPRAMDHWGVIRGDILELAAKISNGL